MWAQRQSTHLTRFLGESAHSHLPAQVTSTQSFCFVREGGRAVKETTEKSLFRAEDCLLLDKVIGDMQQIAYSLLIWK